MLQAMKDTRDKPSKFVLDNGKSVIQSTNGYIMEDGNNLWVSEKENELKLRLLVSAHCGKEVIAVVKLLWRN